MGKIKNGLTVKTVESKKVPGYYADGSNLYLRVTNTLQKTWAFVYKRESKRSEIGMGSVDDLTLAEAREKRDYLNKQLKNGIDPLFEKKRLANETKAQKISVYEFSAMY